MSKDCINLLKHCAMLQSIKVFLGSADGGNNTDFDSSATHHLQLTAVDIACGERNEAIILGMCNLQSVQRLRVRNMQIPEWDQFTNLRSLYFDDQTDLYDENLLAQICRKCPCIVHLQVVSDGWLATEVITEAILALHELRTLYVDFEDDLGDYALEALVDRHTHSLEAVYLFYSQFDSISAAGINQLLAKCGMLRALSFSARNGLDYSLMSKLTTIIIDFPSVSVWSQLQQHCHSLQDLHIVAPAQMPTKELIDWERDMAVCNNTITSLKTIYVARNFNARADDVLESLCRLFPTVQVVDEAEGAWYDLFALPV